MIKKRLFTPGPVSVFPPSLSAALEANIHHRTPEFKEILGQVIGSLRRILGGPEHVYLLASSGSGAMETAVTNFFSQGDAVLVATCGKFGERWVELVQRYGLNAKVLSYPYGEAVKPEDIERELKSNPKVSGVFLQACESSTAVQNDMAAIAQIVAGSDAILIADAVTGLGTMQVSTSMGVDVIISGSQKALMIPPGLGLIGVTKKAWSRVGSATLPRYYFDLRAAHKSWEKEGQTPFTPATSLILSLRSSLNAIEEKGIDHLIRLTENRARATRAALSALSLPIFAKQPASAMTAVVAPGGEADKITSQLKQKFGLQVAGGQGELKGKIFRISHMGYIDHIDTMGVLSALEIVLKNMGHSVDFGASLAAFQNVYAELYS